MSTNAPSQLRRPSDLVAAPGLSEAEKREILASWASDYRAVPNAPHLRRLENGDTLTVDEVMQALRALDGARDEGDTIAAPRRQPFPRRRSARLPRWIGRIPRRKNPGEDDPPPCPAFVGFPYAGPVVDARAA
jgi:hypothetical protein